jgi:predicted nucleic acid-binding protein
MKIAEELSKISTLFIDTAPIIYYIEAHSIYGPISKEIVNFFQSEEREAFSTVLTLTEVLAKPMKIGDEKLVDRFAEFLKYGRNFTLIEISEKIAERAGRLRGRYTELRTIDAVQLASAIENGIEIFITNDKKLKKVDEIKVVVLDDYVKG